MPRTPPTAATLAVVDLGSNSFRLEIGRVEGDQIYRLDTWRETLRFGAGIDARGRLDRRKRGAPRSPASRASASASAACIRRAVRAVATNTFRVATNAAAFLPQAERALGFPIDVISGHEEARLIYNGVAHVLPRVGRAAPRRSTSAAARPNSSSAAATTPQRLESLKIGCVGMTQRFFATVG